MQKLDALAWQLVLKDLTSVFANFSFHKSLLHLFTTDCKSVHFLNHAWRWIKPQHTGHFMSKKFVKIYLCINTTVAGFAMVVMQNLSHLQWGQKPLIRSFVWSHMMLNHTGANNLWLKNVLVCKTSNICCVYERLKFPDLISVIQM